MTEESFKRKLTAILSADVEGYSRLMGEDEDATIRTLTSYRELMSTLVQKHRGRVVDSPGDNLLAEFLSVVDAVRCAVEVQEELRVRNAELPDNRKMEFRIGINLGDVVEEGERIYGDGINIAARVEGIAEGGGICISGTVYDSIKNKLSLSYEALGEHTVKNIKEPVRVYRMRIGPEAAAPVVREEKAGPRRWHKAALAAVAVLVVVAGAWAIWNFYFRPPPIEPASVEKMAYPLPEKPSIAVLPFANMSGDPEQDYIADGITDNIITALSYIPEMFVIARNSSFTYKGKPVKIQQVSEELGVRYILEGSVLKSGDKVRIAAQLIDALTGGHIWSERYDRDLKDFLNLLDEITLAIVVALQVELTDGEQSRMYYGSTSNFEAWGHVVKGTGIFYSFSKEAMAKSRELFGKALELDPNYANAATVLAWTHFIDARWGYTDSRDESFKRAVELVKKSLALDDNQPMAHTLLAYIFLIQKQHNKAIEQGRKAIALGPNDADANQTFGEILYRSGIFEEAVQMLEKAMRLFPHPPRHYFGHMMSAYYWVGRYEESLAMAEQLIDRGRKAKDRWSEWWGYWGSARAHIRLGQENKAREDVANSLKIRPEYSLDLDRRNTFYKPEIIEREYVDMRKAGFPEHPPLPLPDKPSIAVLPFTNMSDDPKQEYFSDGMTEEIITALSKTPKLFVIARNSTFTYKGKPVKVQQVGRELGVKYVLEGSVRKAGEKVRITAQLVDATTGNHLWAERYDRDLKDIFALQDEITKEIITAMQVKLTTGDAERLYAKGTDNLEAYLKCLQARELLQGAITKEKNVLARRLAQEAIDLDPNYSEAYRELAITYAYDVYIRTTKSPRESLERAAVLTKKAIALDNSNAHAYSLLAEIYVMFRQYEKAVAAVEHAFALEPNSPQILYRYGRVLWSVGRWEEGLPYYEEAMRLNPIPPNILLRFYGAQLRELERYDEAIAVLKRAVEQEPERNMWTYLMLAVTYSLAGREDDARETAKEVLRINPKFSVKFMERIITFKDPAHTKRLTTAMRKAGLPD